MSKSQQEQYTGAGSESHFSLVNLVLKARAFVLLFALLVQILLSGPDVGGKLVDFIIRALTITAAIIVTADNKRHLIIGMVLGIPSLILVILVYVFHHHVLDWFTMAFLLALYLFIIRLMLIQIFYAKVITLNTIGLALCTYILIGTVWVLFYTPVVALDPNAFSQPIIDEGETFQTLTYFSYVTLTTLGYGDISPVSNIARNLAVLEAITGTLFLAVLISRLVGSYGTRKKE
jgi:hypothetical protein